VNAGVGRLKRQLGNGVLVLGFGEEGSAVLPARTGASVVGRGAPMQGPQHQCDSTRADDLGKAQRKRFLDEIHHLSFVCCTIQRVPCQLANEQAKAKIEQIKRLAPSELEVRFSVNVRGFHVAFALVVSGRNAHDVGWKLAPVAHHHHHAGLEAAPRYFNGRGVPAAGAAFGGAVRAQDFGEAVVDLVVLVVPLLVFQALFHLRRID